MLQWYSTVLFISLKACAAVLTPSTDIQICPAGMVATAQTLSFVCNVTGSIYWKITINGRSEHVDFNSRSMLNVNRYSGGRGIEVTLSSIVHQRLTSVASINVPPFDITAYNSVTLTCNRQSRAILRAGKLSLVSNKIIIGSQ